MLTECDIFLFFLMHIKLHFLLAYTCARARNYTVLICLYRGATAALKKIFFFDPRTMLLRGLQLCLEKMLAFVYVNPGSDVKEMSRP